MDSSASNSRLAHRRDKDGSRMTLLGKLDDENMVNEEYGFDKIITVENSQVNLHD